MIYELLDEIMDYGVPQITETELLKAYIQEGGTPKALNDLGKYYNYIWKHIIIVR